MGSEEGVREVDQPLEAWETQWAETDSIKNCAKLHPVQTRVYGLLSPVMRSCSRVLAARASASALAWSTFVRRVSTCAVTES
jgi:hypothetical protein